MHHSTIAKESGVNEQIDIELTIYKEKYDTKTKMFVRRHTFEETIVISKICSVLIVFERK